MSKKLVKLMWNPKKQIPMPRVCLDDICQQKRKDKLNDFVLLIDKENDDILIDICQHQKEAWGERDYASLRESGYNFAGHTLLGSKIHYNIYRLKKDEFIEYLKENPEVKREIHPDVLIDLGLTEILFTIPYMRDYSNK